MECAPRPPLCGEPWPLPPASGQIQYHFNDHLGTARQSVDSDGTVHAEVRLGPYGEELAGPGCAQRMVFTGHERDRDTGLDYMRARYYGRHIARFLSVDPATGGVLQTRAWKRYSYVLGNPPNHVDPHGLSAQCTPTGCSITVTPQDDDDAAESAEDDARRRERVRRVMLELYRMSHNQWNSDVLNAPLPLCLRW